MPTLQDIANIAQFSKATVSLALSNHPRISEATKTKIRKVAMELGYITEESAADEPVSKPVNKRRSLGVLYIGESGHSIGQGFFRETLMGIIQEASRSYYNVVMIEVHASSEKITEEELCEKINNSEVDGVVVICFKPELYGFNSLIDQNFPMVFVGNRRIAGRDVRLNMVTTDNHEGAKRVTEYLLDMGHSRIAIAMSPTTSTERLNGYFSALRNAGLPTLEERVMMVSTPLITEDEGWRIIQEHNITAIFATTTLVGLIVLQYLRIIGKQIPDDISLIVFDDNASFLIENPPITVMKQELESLGTYSVKLLIDLMDNPLQSPKQVSLSTQMLERKSCKPPKPEAR